MRLGAAVLVFILAANAAQTNVLDDVVALLFPYDKVLIAGSHAPSNAQRITKAAFERLLLHPEELERARVALMFEKPRIARDQATVRYRAMKRVTGGVEAGSGVVTMRREAKRWVVVDQHYDVEIRPRREEALLVGGDVKAPVLLHRVEPVYTKEALAARVSGIVIVETLIDRTGHVVDVNVLKPLPFGLDQAAIEAVKQWEYRPGTLNGQPVDVIFDFTVSFRPPAN